MKPDDAKRPTIRDVATVAGVSAGTVSRVLNGKNWVSPEAKIAVDAAIKKTGYRVNPHARSLVTSRSNTVAFLLTEPQQLLFEDPNYSMLVRGTAKALAAHNMSLVLIIAGDEAERARAMSYIMGGHVDGVLVAFSSRSGSGLVHSLVEARVPIVACGRPIGFEGPLACVSVDEREGAERVVSYLAERGRSRIATITGPQGSPGGIGRLAGYRAVLGEAFDDALVEVGDYSQRSGNRAMRALVDRAPDLDAVFAANDAMAAGAIDALHALGRRVPEDVAVVGFDDSVFALHTSPQLTTMRQPFDRISTEMVRLLLGEIGGDGAATITLPTTLVERESA